MRANKCVDFDLFKHKKTSRDKLGSGQNKKAHYPSEIYAYAGKRSVAYWRLTFPPG